MIFSCLLFLLVSCKKNLQEEVQNPQEILKELNAQQKEIAKIVDSRMELILLVTMDILHDNPALKTEVVKAIHTNRKAGKDEAIYMQDLLSANSNLSPNFRNDFLAAFGSRLESGDFPNAVKVKEELEIVRSKGRKKQAVIANILTESPTWDFDYVLMVQLVHLCISPFQNYTKEIAI